MQEKINHSQESFWICPLYAFECTADVSEHIDLGGGVAIWRMHHNLRHLVDEHIRELELRMNKVEWVIQIPPDPKGRVTPEGETLTPEESMLLGLLIHDDVGETMIDMLTALRLQHAGSVAPGPLVYLLGSGQNFEYGNVTIWTRLSKTGDYFAPAEDCYNLLQAEVETVGELWRSIQDRRKAAKPNALRIALHRFNSSYGEGPEDRLLDQMIALESLYLGDNKELGYKLALRAAFLLGREEKERKQIFDRLKKAYTARGTIVHGGERPANLRELVVETEEYLRQSIKQFLKLSSKYSLKQLRERLFDQNIIEAGRLLIFE